MKASELITELQKLVQEHGDQEMYMYNESFEDGGRAFDVSYAEAIEEVHYYQSDPPGEGKGFCITGWL